MALFGESWTRSFGEIPDESGQWTKTLSGVSRAQIADGLDIVRNSGRKWPPAAPEFKAMCLSLGIKKHPPMEACYAELTGFISENRKDSYNLSHILYHTIRRNMDLYNYKKIEKDWDRIKSFEIAYKATLFQLECGEQLIEIPKPETLICADKTPNNTDSIESEKVAMNNIADLKNLLGIEL